MEQPKKTKKPLKITNEERLKRVEAREAIKGAGRPSKFTKDNIKKAYLLGKKGFTNEEIAKVFGVSLKTIKTWKKDYPLFGESLAKGKKICDDAVEKSLYERALGYSHPEVTINVVKGEIVKTETIKHYPPDPTSMIFWLKNRRRKEWRDRHDAEITVNSLSDIAALMGGQEPTEDDSE